MSLLRPPSRWLDSQATFEAQFRTQPGKLPNRPVYVRWWTSIGPLEGTTSRARLPNAPRWDDLSQGQLAGLGLALVVATLFLFGVDAIAFAVRLGIVVVVVLGGLVTFGAVGSGAATIAGRKYAAVFLPQADLRSAPLLVFEVDAGSFGGSRSGQGSAMLFGTLSPNAAVCLLHDGLAVWPQSPPVRRQPDAPGR